MSDRVGATPSGPVAVLAAEEDLLALNQSVTEVLAEQCDSLALHAYLDGKSQLDQTLWRYAAELGWLAAALPEDVGGLGFGPQAADVVNRAVGRYAAPGPFIPTLAAALWIAENAPSDQRAALLPGVCAGDVSLATPALVPDVAGLEVGSDGARGSLRVLGAGQAGFAVTPLSDTGAPGWGVVRIDGERARLRPLSSAWDRTRPLCNLVCDGAEILFWLEDPEAELARGLARHLALGLASDCIGAAAGISGRTVEYMKTRVQFDRLIGSFQALKHRVADQMIKIVLGEHTVTQGVEAAALGDRDADLWAALAKAGASETFNYVAADCVQLHGGVGHTWAFDCHIYMKRARLNEALGASNAAQRDFAARALAAAALDGRTCAEIPL